MDRTPGPRARARLRWGLPDVLLAWVAGILAAILAVPLADPDVSASKQPIGYIVASLLLQNLGIVLALWIISERKGQRSLTRDFGWIWPLRRLRPLAAVGWIAAGAALSWVAVVLLAPITRIAHLKDSAQEVAKSVERAGGAGLVLLLVGIVFVAPAVEELLFRGALLRALQRRYSVPVAVFVSAAVFAGVHVLFDPGSAYVVPGLLVLGLVSGWEAARTGDLGRSVLLHMGFNLLSALSLALK